MTTRSKTLILTALAALTFLVGCKPACPVPTAPPPIESCDPRPGESCTPEHP